MTYFEFASSIPSSGRVSADVIFALTIVSLNDDPVGGLPTVTFRYRSISSRHCRLIAVPVLEFICRLFQHGLRRGFVKVRYYEFFSSGQRTKLQEVAA